MVTSKSKINTVINSYTLTEVRWLCRESVHNRRAADAWRLSTATDSVRPHLHAMQHVQKSMTTSGMLTKSLHTARGQSISKHFSTGLTWVGCNIPFDTVFHRSSSQPISWLVQSTEGESCYIPRWFNHPSINWAQHWIVQCFTSPPTQYRLYGNGFYRSKDPTNSIKVLKEKAVKENNPKNKENTKYTYAYTHKIAYKYSIHE